MSNRATGKTMVKGWGENRSHTAVLCACNRVARLQCDAPSGEVVTKGGFDLPKPCNSWTCEGCAVLVGPGRHFCRRCYSRLGMPK